MSLAAHLLGIGFMGRYGLALFCFSAWAEFFFQQLYGCEESV